MSGSTSSDEEVHATPIVIVAGPDLDTDFTSKSHLLVDGKEASIAFLREYFRNGKDAARADKTVRNKQGYLSLSGVYLKQFLHKNRGEAGAATVIHYFNDSTAAAYDRAVASASVLLISTTLMPTWSFVESLADRAKRINPTITVIAGGVSVYKIAKARKMLDAGLFEATPKLREFWKFLMKPYQSKIDFAIASVAGEQILLTLLDCLEQGSDAWKTMPNVIWYDPSVGDFHMNELVEEKSSDCEVDWSREKCPEGSIYPVQAGQGCPYKCGFCDFVALEPVVYRCNTNAVMNTVRSIPLYKGHRRVWFTNDNLLVTRSVAVNFLTELIRQDLHCRWYSFLRLDAVADAELADLIAQSGCERANFGLESGDQTILDNMEKHCRVEDIPRGINFLLERNIIVRVSVIVGYPGETKETIMKTVKLVNSIQDTGVFEVKVRISKNDKKKSRFRSCFLSKRCSRLEFSQWRRFRLGNRGKDGDCKE
ncbi:radical SAM protein [Pelomyxa schiedti]|nr:radical SAM protein [Pelomyxa schiedti]